MNDRRDEGSAVDRITARQLSRQSGEVLDRVASGRTLLLYRFGEPLALITPIAKARGTAMRVVDEVIEPTQEEIAAVPRDPLQRRILLRLEKGMAHLDTFVREGVELQRAGIALTSLELAGLAQKVIGGYKITGKGLRIIKAMKSRGDHGQIL